MQENLTAGLTPTSPDSALLSLCNFQITAPLTHSDTYIACGSKDACLSDAEIRSHLFLMYERLGERNNVLIVPPDQTRRHSRAELITKAAYNFYGDAVTAIMPALGTHQKMSDAQIASMYPGVPRELFCEHNWLEDVVRIGTIPADFVEQVTEGLYRAPWPVEINRRIVHGGHDLILSVGQVVPHEVVGMANHAKNILIGCGGAGAIDQSHFIGALYGMERMMGRTDTPVRKIFSRALEEFCSHLNIVFVMTVVGPAKDGEPANEHGLVTRGLFAGTGFDCFERAADLSREVNFQLLDKEINKAVVYLNPEQYNSTWIGNKAIYRTRMAIADGGELIVIAPGVERFGENREVDRLILKYGYRTTPEILTALEKNQDLSLNLAAAAHLIHGSSEERFKITYAPGGLTKEMIEGVGYNYMDPEMAMKKYNPEVLKDGWNLVDGEEIFFISDPGLTLCAYRGRFESKAKPVPSVSRRQDSNSRVANSRLGAHWQNAIKAAASHEVELAATYRETFKAELQNTKPTGAASYALRQLEEIIASGVKSVNIMGTMGSGKSEIAKALAAHLGFQYMDADLFHSDEARKKLHQGIPLNNQDRIPFLTGVRDYLSGAKEVGRISSCSALTDVYRAIIAGQDIEILERPELDPWDSDIFHADFNYGLLEIWIQKPYTRALAQLDKATKDPNKARTINGHTHFISVTKENPALLKNQYALLKKSPPLPFQAIFLRTDDYYDEIADSYDQSKIAIDLGRFIGK